MYPTTQISYGQSGPEVTKLQNFLIGQGMTIPAGPTGYFGDQTKKALLQWQQSVGVQAPAADLGSNWGPKSIEKASLVNSNKAPVAPTDTSVPYNASVAPAAPTRSLSFAPTSTQPTSSISSSAAQPGMIRPSGGGAETINPLHNTVYGGVSEEQAKALKAYGISPSQWNGDMQQGGQVGQIWLRNAIAQYSQTSQQAPPTEQAASAPISSVSDIDKAIEETLAAILGSGYAINPGLTDEDIAAIDPAKFMTSAAATIAPEYQQKFATAADTLKRALGNATEDYSVSTAKTAREADQTLLEGTETLAGRGLAFSGARQKFIGDVEQSRTLGFDEAARNAQRAGQSALSTAEGLIGTTGVQNLGINTNIGGRNLQFASTPIVGQYTSEKTYTTEAIAKELAAQEAKRRAYATRSLSFA